MFVDNTSGHTCSQKSGVAENREVSLFNRRVFRTECISSTYPRKNRGTSTLEKFMVKEAMIDLCQNRIDQSIHG